MASLDVLARLAQQAVDRERQALMQINKVMAEVEKQIEILGAQAEAEATKGADFMGAGATLSAFLQVSRMRVHAARGELAKLRADHANQLDKLKQQRIELKRYELLAERRAKREADALATKEQKVIDELVTIKAGRRRPANG